MKKQWKWHDEYYVLRMDIVHASVELMPSADESELPQTPMAAAAVSSNKRQLLYECICISVII
jgi:hypothetical protein